MPRKGKNNAPAGKENRSIDPNESRLVQKDQFLNDFDIQVAEKVRDMQTELKKIVGLMSRMVTTEKLKLTKELRKMTVRDFLAKGGDLDSLEFKEVSSPAVSDISYSQSMPVDDSSILETQKSEANQTGTAKTKRNAPRKVLLGKRDAAETSLVRNALRNTRAKKNVLETPVGNKFGFRQPLPTPIITPKFDPSKPVTAAREPKQGETLVSLSGSPVVKTHCDKPDEDSNLVSVLHCPQQTLLGGRLFLDEEMSPNTLLQTKQVMEDAMVAINSRLVELTSQVTASSRLDQS